MSGACIVGAGAVGTSLALRLHEVGRPVSCVISRSREPAEELSGRLGGTEFHLSPAAVPHDVKLILICVPDDALEAVALKCRRSRDDWTGSFIVHVSGRHSARVLHPFASAGGTIAGFHPLQSFPRRYDPRAFEGISIGIEAPDGSWSPAASLAKQIGARPVRVSESDKVLYHLVASVASNFLTVLLKFVEEGVGQRSSESTWDLASFEPLIRTTIRNTLLEGATTALTGPVVRGDRRTVDAHLASLQELLPHWEEVYRVLGRGAVRIARDSGRLSPDRADELERMLIMHLKP